MDRIIDAISLFVWVLAIVGVFFFIATGDWLWLLPGGIALLMSAVYFIIVPPEP